MQYAIIENEYHSLLHIKDSIGNLRPDWQLAFTAGSINDTIRSIKEHGLPDLIFMDIELDDGNSFQIFDKVEIKTPVIFTTAYDEYCLKAFRQFTIDYILKPITTDDLLFAIRKFETMNSCREDCADRYQKLTQIKPESKSQPIRILISRNDSYEFISTKDIAWFESEDKCVFVMARDGRRLITTFNTLNEVEEILPQPQFFRISRAFVVSIDSITDVKKSFNYKLSAIVEAKGVKKKVDISSARRKEFLSWFGHGRV